MEKYLETTRLPVQGLGFGADSRDLGSVVEGYLAMTIVAILSGASHMQEKIMG